jgi:hypothetical protein
MAFRLDCRLHWYPSRSLPRLWEGLHLAPVFFAPLHALQFAGALSGSYSYRRATMGSRRMARRAGI